MFFQMESSRSCEKKEQEIGGKLLSYDENTIEIEGYGRISHTGKIPVYEL